MKLIQAHISLRAGEGSPRTRKPSGIPRLALFMEATYLSDPLFCSLKAFANEVSTFNVACSTVKLGRRGVTESTKIERG